MRGSNVPWVCRLEGTQSVHLKWATYHSGFWHQGCGTSIAVYLDPKSENAIRWIGMNLIALQRAFVTVHRREDQGHDVRRFHPHGVLFEVPRNPVRGTAPLHVYVDASGSVQHAQQTKRDLEEALTLLGAALGEFDLRHTEEAEAQ